MLSNATEASASFWWLMMTFINHLLRNCLSPMTFWNSFLPSLNHHRNYHRFFFPPQWPDKPVWSYLWFFLFFRWLQLHWYSWYGDLHEPACGGDHSSPAYALLHDEASHQSSAFCGNLQLSQWTGDPLHQLERGGQLCGGCGWPGGQDYWRVRSNWHRSPGVIIK